MELSELIAEIKRDGKMSTDGLLMTLSEAIQNEEEPSCIFKKLYEKSYGEHLSENIAKNWVKHMSVNDDSGRATGEKWTYEQTTEVGNKLDINWSHISKWEWYCAMNGAYSDYYSVANEWQVADDPMFFASLAKAFWCKDDDVKGKTIFSYYFNYVA